MQCNAKKRALEEKPITKELCLLARLSWL